MKLIIDNSNLKMAPELFLRQAGYAYLPNNNGQDSFIRRLGGNFYPRFHIYLDNDGKKTVFNLHLDQKKPSYLGAHAHNAEYDGENIEEELNRLKNLI